MELVKMAVGWSVR